MAKHQPLSEQQVSSEQISAVIKRFPGCKIEAEATVTPKAAKEAHLRAIKNVNKEVNIPGFRKGKAPDALVQKNYSSSIDREWRDLVANQAFFDLVNLGKLVIFKDGVKKVEIRSCSQEDGANVYFEMEAFPEIPEIDASTFEIKIPETKEISESDVDETLRTLGLRMAEWEAVTDRAAQEGDIVVIDVEVLEDPVHKPVQDAEAEVSPRGLPSWMRRLVIGLKEGEHAEGISEWEPDFAPSKDKQPPKDFKPRQSRVTVKKIFFPKVPEINDEFAKKHGVDTVAALREAIKKQREVQEKISGQDAQRVQARDLLVERYVFDVPARRLESELEYRKRQVENQLKQQQFKPEDIKSKLGNLEGEIEKESHNAVRFYYLIQHLSQKNSIMATQKDIESYFAQRFMDPVFREMFINKQVDMDNMRAMAENNIIETKVLDYIIEHSKRT